MRNPFTDDICLPGDAGAEPAVKMFQAEAMGVLEGVMKEESGAMGRSLVVTAPRAGYGKTHLVGRFAAGLAGRAMVVPLEFDRESPPQWAGVLGSVVGKWHRDHGQRAGLTMLDEAARFLFALANQRLIESGQIPCAHPAEAVAALRRNYLEMFDFSDSGQEVARWFSGHFEGLVPLTSGGLAPEAGVDPESTGHWLRLLLSYAQGVEDLPSQRLEGLKWALHMSGGPALAGAGGGGLLIQESASPEQSCKQKLRDLGRLLSLYRPMVFVLDHLDGFHRDPQAGLQIAYFVSELRRLLPRSLTVVCLNQDVWQSTFQGQLPSALEDRMAGEFVGLQGLNRAQAIELVVGRLQAAGVAESERKSFWLRLELDDFMGRREGQAVSPRAVLRHAAKCWARRGWSLPEPAPPLQVPLPPPMVLIPDAPGQSSPVDSAPGTSVVGMETLDSISAALQAMVGTSGDRSYPESAASQASSFHQLREKLDRLRPVAEGGTSDANPPPNGHSTTADGPIARHFGDRLQRRREAPVPPTLDLERLGRLLRFAGRHFPAVRAAELGVPGTSGTALQWLSPDAEVLIGLEPPTRPIFWSALTAHAAARLKLNGGIPVKLVAFTEPELATHPAVTSQSIAGYAVDLVAPGFEELQRLAAACDVLDAATSAESSEEVASLLARELEPFWRRLTRLAAVPSA